MTQSTSTKKPKTKSKIKAIKCIRKKNEREILKGYTCPHCKGFYEALGFNKKYTNYLIQLGSRHRHEHTPPSSPKSFWNISDNF